MKEKELLLFSCAAFYLCFYLFLILRVFFPNLYIKLIYQFYKSYHSELIRGKKINNGREEKKRKEHIYIYIDSIGGFSRIYNCLEII